MAQASGYGNKFNEAYQERLLALVCRDAESVLRYRSAINGDYFGSFHGHVAKRALELTDKHRQSPAMETLWSRLSSDISEPEHELYRKLLKHVYGLKLNDRSMMLESIIDWGKERAMQLAIIESVNLMKLGKRAEVSRLIREAEKVGDDLRNTPIDYHNATSEDRLDWEDKPGIVVPTALQHLDIALKGGGRRGEIITFMGNAKKGKTTVLINIAYGVVTNPRAFNCLYISAELRKNYVAKRIDHRFAGPLMSLINSDGEAYRDKITERVASRVKGKLFLHSFSTKKLSVSGIQTIMEDYAAAGTPIDALIVDHAGILKPVRNKDKSHEAIAGIYEDLRELAGETNCVVYTASQAKAVAEGKETVLMNDVGGAYEISQVVDGMLAWVQTDEEAAEKTARIINLGYRNNESGQVINCNIDRSRCFIQTTGIADQKMVVEFKKAQQSKRRGGGGGRGRYDRVLGEDE